VHVMLGCHQQHNQPGRLQAGPLPACEVHARKIGW
jgi:hypothetical protein